MRTKTIGYLEPAELTDELFDVLEQMAILKNEDSGFSFLTSRSWIQIWLDDAKTDFDRSGQQHPCFIQATQLVDIMTQQNLDCVMVCKDKDLELK